MMYYFSIDWCVSLYKFLIGGSPVPSVTASDRRGGLSTLTVWSLQVGSLMRSSRCTKHLPGEDLDLESKN